MNQLPPGYPEIFTDDESATPIATPSPTECSETAEPTKPCSAELPSSVSMAGIIDRKFLVPPATQQPHIPGHPPFWTWVGRPNRTAPPNLLFPFSTHQPAAGPPHKDHLPAAASLTPFDVAASEDSGPGLAGESAVTWIAMDRQRPDSPAEFISRHDSEPPGARFVGGHADALLLETMDNHRNRAQDWVERARRLQIADDDSESVGSEWDITMDDGSLSEGGEGMDVEVEGMPMHFGAGSSARH
ncbi:hypothetical protein VTK56DRAFT_3262 [Thermocarpiscus australiensis]